MKTQAAYKCNGALIAPEAFYAIACDPQRSVAVEACAGAGKTWMLVSRMVRALLEDADQAGADGALKPQEILAITFTKRAAGEMRERLYEWLTDFARADNARLFKELQIRGVPGLHNEADAQRLTARLQGLYAHMLASGRSVQIRTFHGWFAALLRSAPVAVLQNLALPVNYELLEDDSQARALVWRRFYQALLDEPAQKADFEAVVMAWGRSQTEKALQAALDKRVEFGLADAAGLVDVSVQTFDQQYPEFAHCQQPDQALTDAPGRQLLNDAATALGRAKAPSFSAMGVELERALTDGNMDVVFKCLLTKEGTARKFGEKINGIETVRQAQALVLQVAAVRHQHEAWLHQLRMARLARLLISEFTALKRDRGWIDMNDVERAALVMLGDPVLSGWVQERLDARVRHLLIDEFQDTNPLQWQALSAWLGSYGGAGRAPSVFIVGDPKQSIYRFRRAEPQVFRAAQNFVRQGLAGDLLSCDHTRRNAQAVISTVNAAMRKAAEDDGYEGFRAHSSDSPDIGAVGRLPVITRTLKDQTPSMQHDSPLPWRDSLLQPREVLEETLRTLEARQAAAWIAQQLAPISHSSGAPLLKPAQVMVLSRKRAGLLPLQQELRVLGIPAQIGEKTALIDCCEVQDITALLDVLVSPQHDLSLARVLRSPLFGVTDAALVQLALAQRRLSQPWYDLLQTDASEPIDELRAADALCLQGVAAQLARWRLWLDTLPPHDALQAVYDDGDVLARFAAAAPAAQRDAVLANLRALLAVALQIDGGRYTTPYALVRALRAGGILAPATVSPDAVRLLTIHGAKGLEAEAVLLLDTDTPPRNAESMAVLLDWPGEAAVPQRFVFLVSESKPPACCVKTLEAEKIARQREELNALYVALTRSRKTLVLSSIEAYRSAPDSWWQRLHALAAEWPAPTAPASASAPAEPSDEVFDFLSLPPAVVLPSGAARPAADSAASRTGQAMHRLLEWGTLSALHVKAVTREFRLDATQAQTALSGAQRILAGEGAWAWDPAVINWQGNEVELAYLGQSIRLDRLVQRCDAGHEGHWWVLDYKSNAAPQALPELRQQMQIYRDAVMAVYPGQTVKAAFLTAQGRLLEVD
jgi:ATP-dependent helicase/nuclease subunit A